MNIEQALLNQGTPCKFPTPSDHCLKKHNYLSEFLTSSDKERARINLGLTDLFSSEFGERVDIGINLKTLTKFLGFLLDLYHPINININPISEGVNITISGPKWPLDKVNVYLNNELVYSIDNPEMLDELLFNTTLDIKSGIIKVEAFRLGYITSKEMEIEKEFYIGDDPNILGNPIYKRTSRVIQGFYDITISIEGNIMAVATPVGEITTVKLNGFVIPMTKTRATFDNIEYDLFLSENTYKRGTYNIELV